MLAQLANTLPTDDLSYGYEFKVEQLVDENVPAALKADFLCHLALKGETVDEIAAFAGALREKSVQPPLDPATRAAEPAPHDM